LENKNKKHGNVRYTNNEPIHPESKRKDKAGNKEDEYLNPKLIRNF
jgi:hypothetical protein